MGLWEFMALDPLAGRGGRLCGRLAVALVGKNMDARVGPSPGRTRGSGIGISLLDPITSNS
jgi:hypothetical protein